MNIVNNVMEQMQLFVEREQRKQLRTSQMYGELEEFKSHDDQFEHDGSVEYDIEAWGE